VTVLPHDDACELAHALVEYVANEAGVRVLAIKGSVPERHGLRVRRKSMDADVLVEPMGASQLVEAMSERGWRAIVEPVKPNVLADHSATLRHSHWPVEIDLHFVFPGFLADPVRVFDALWRERSEFVMASRQVQAAGPLASALIMDLHAQRDRDPGAYAEEVASAVGALREVQRFGSPTRLGEFAREVGADFSAEDFLLSCGVPRPQEPPPDAEALAAWRFRSSLGDARSAAWFVELLQIPLREWPPLLVRGLMLTEPALRHRYPLAPPGLRGVWLARWWRLKAAIPHLPKAVALALRARRQRTGQ
jgi:hypothetical protein